MRSGGITHCTLCPRACGADRTGRNEAGSAGFCGGGSAVRIARAALHFWEEPCISGDNGSGAVFFSGCPLQCCFCQNAVISDGNFGAEITVERLAEIFLSLQEEGAHNINLVSPTHYTPWILDALDTAGDRLQIPTVYNTSGYESLDALKMLDGYFDVYLPDFKYMSPYMSQRYSSAPDYFDRASDAVAEMFRQTGPVQLDENGILQKGTLVRHLVLPGGVSDSISLFNRLAKILPADEILVSVMSQYTPCHRSGAYPEINRTITPAEYEAVTEHVRALGFRGYFQDPYSARDEYTPPFDLTGV